MKKVYFVLVGLCVLVAWFGLDFQTSAQQSEIYQTADSNQVSPNIVVSQFQVAGDSTINPSQDEFIELHNISQGSVDLNGMRVVYRSNQRSPE